MLLYFICLELSTCFRRFHSPAVTVCDCSHAATARCFHAFFCVTFKEKSGFFTPGQFIENQNEWESVRFGLSTMKYSGCEIISVYNALPDLGNRMTVQAMAALIGAFERRGAERKGRWGCSPGSIRKYLIRRGYMVSMTTGTKPEIIKDPAASNRVSSLQRCRAQCVHRTLWYLTLAAFVK